MAATAQEQKTIRPIRPCFTIHKEYIHYDEIDGDDEVTPSNEFLIAGGSKKDLLRD